MNRRARKDYPQGVLTIYDNNGKTTDRYAVVFTPWRTHFGTPVYPILTMSEAPFWPQGVCMHDSSIGYRPTGLGKVRGWAEMPEDCQRAILRDL